MEESTRGVMLPSQMTPTASLVHRLWQDRAPLAVGDEAGDVPTLTVYQPTSGTAPRAAVVVLPGGGYGQLAAHEGEPVALWLNSIGITAAVLKYRLAPQYRHPAPLLDAQRALRTMRAFSQEWNVDPKRVGILGFSAGGHLTASASNLFDDGLENSLDPVERFGCRPDVSIPTYPVISFEQPYSHFGSRDNLLGPRASASQIREMSMETRVSPRTPPTFIFHTMDDGAVPVENALTYASALREAGVPFELHVFQKGNHGVGLAQDNATLKVWPSLCGEWLRVQGFCD